jgi:hypothetical protein
MSATPATVEQQIDHAAYNEAAEAPPAPAQKAQVNARIVTVTPAMAEKWLAHNSHNRSVTMSRVDQYAADMRKGEWQINGEAIKISATGQILDGQHRVMAILEADVPVSTLVITGLPSEAQETMDQGRNRSFGDVLKLRGEKDYFALASAVRYLFFFEQTGIPVASGHRGASIKEMSRTLERNSEIRDSIRLASKLKKSWVPYSLVAALHFLFASVAQADADDFITKLCTGENHGTGDPTYVLRERLIREHYAGAGAHVKVKTALIIKAWNAYRNGDTVLRLNWNPGGANPDRFPDIHGISRPGEAAR